MNAQVITLILIVAFNVWIVGLVLHPIITLAATVAYLIWVVYKLLSGFARVFRR